MKKKPTKISSKHATVYLSEEEDKQLEELREVLTQHGIKPSRSEILKMTLRRAAEDMLEGIERMPL